MTHVVRKANGTQIRTVSLSVFVSTILAVLGVCTTVIVASLSYAAGTNQMKEVIVTRAEWLQHLRVFEAHEEKRWHEETGRAIIRLDAAWHEHARRLERLER